MFIDEFVSLSSLYCTFVIKKNKQKKLGGNTMTPDATITLGVNPKLRPSHYKDYFFSEPSGPISRVLL